MDLIHPRLHFVHHIAGHSLESLACSVTKANQTAIQQTDRIVNEDPLGGLRLTPPVFEDLVPDRMGKGMHSQCEGGRVS